MCKCKTTPKKNIFRSKRSEYIYALLSKLAKHEGLITIHEWVDRMNMDVLDPQPFSFSGQTRIARYVKNYLIETYDCLVEEGIKFKLNDKTTCFDFVSMAEGMDEDMGRKAYEKHQKKDKTPPATQIKTTWGPTFVHIENEPLDKVTFDSMGNMVISFTSGSILTLNHPKKR